MSRCAAYLLAAVLWGGAALAQQEQGEEEVAPDEEFLPWSGGTALPPPPPSPGPAPVAPRKRPLAPAQEEEEEQAAGPAAGDEGEWNAPPGLGAPAPAPPPPPPPPVLVPSPSVRAPPPPPRELNRVSLYGGLNLGQWRRALGFYLGFPLVGFKAGIGLAERLDAGVGFDTFYGAMNEPRAFVRFGLLRGPRWNVAAQLEGGAAFFSATPQADLNGARWLTGRRNYNVEAGVVASFQGDSAQAARLFLDGRYLLALDTQTFVPDPLGGVPPSLIVGHNATVRVGAEMPFSPATSFLFIFGFDLHTRAGDVPFMPVVSVGLVTGV